MMESQNKKIVLQKTYSYYLAHMEVLLIIVVIISALSWWTFDLNIGILLASLQLLLGTLPILLFAIIVSEGSNKQVKSTPNLQYPENLDIMSRKHDAFIIVESAGIVNFYGGLDNIIPKFKKKGYPFRIYHCKTSDDFKAVLLNEKANCLWIFGHGWRGGITFKGRMRLHNLRYCKLRDRIHFSYSDLIENGMMAYPSKDFIVQLHCNCFVKKEVSNTPLPEYLMQNNLNPECYHVSDNKNNIISIWFTTRKLMKNIKRTPISSDKEMITE